jgi:hypothetical protein
MADGRIRRAGAGSGGSRRTLGSPGEALSDCARLKVKGEGRWTIGPAILLDYRQSTLGPSLGTNRGRPAIPIYRSVRERFTPA